MKMKPTTNILQLYEICRTLKDNAPISYWKLYTMVKDSPHKMSNNTVFYSLKMLENFGYVKSKIDLKHPTKKILYTPGPGYDTYLLSLRIVRKPIIKEYLKTIEPNFKNG